MKVFRPTEKTVISITVFLGFLTLVNLSILALEYPHNFTDWMDIAVGSAFFIFITAGAALVTYFQAIKLSSDRLFYRNDLFFSKSIAIRDITSVRVGYGGLIKYLSVSTAIGEVARITISTWETKTVAELLNEILKKKNDIKIAKKYEKLLAILNTSGFKSEEKLIDRKEFGTLSANGLWMLGAFLFLMVISIFFDVNILHPFD